MAQGWKGEEGGRRRRKSRAPSSRSLSLSRHCAHLGRVIRELVRLVFVADIGAQHDALERHATRLDRLQADVARLPFRLRRRRKER